MPVTSHVLADQEIEERLLKHAPRWALVDDRICRTWRTHGWKATLMAVNAVGHLAELAWHHPEIIATFGSIEVRLSTHDANGITDKDFALAARIDGVLDWRPGEEGGALGGIPVGDKSGAYFRD